MRNNILYLLAILLVSCSETVINMEGSSISLEGDDTTHVYITEYLKIVECVPLIETEECILGNIRNIEEYDNEYYILGKFEKTGIVVFNKDGEFVRKIGNYGNGRGEYSKILDYTVDQKNKRVLVLLNDSKLKIYDLKGNYISEETLTKSLLYNIACIDGNILCTTNHQTYTSGEDAFLFYVFDENFKKIKKHTNVLSTYMGMFSLNLHRLMTNQRKFYYTDFYTHNIYVLDKLGNIEQIFSYDKSSLMPTEYFKGYTTFTENQMKFDFVFNNIIIGGNIITIYKDKEQLRIAINDVEGNTKSNKALKGIMPECYMYKDNFVLSSLTNEQMTELSIPLPSVKNTYQSIIKYTLKR